VELVNSILKREKLKCQVSQQAKIVWETHEDFALTEKDQTIGLSFAGFGCCAVSVLYYYDTAKDWSKPVLDKTFSLSSPPQVVLTLKLKCKSYSVSYEAAVIYILCIK
jgi:hypothetical protein